MAKLKRNPATTAAFAHNIDNYEIGPVEYPRSSQ